MINNTMRTVRYGVSVILIIFITPSFAHSDSDKIDKAIGVVESLCLSGTEYGISADGEGNITIKSFNPKVSGSVTLNVREARGATAFQDHLRLIADDKVRECTQKQIGRILDAVLETTKSTVIVSRGNQSISTAKYLGYVPDQVSVSSFIEGDGKSYYRFSVKEASNIKITFSKNSQQINMSVLSGKKRSIATGNFQKGRSTEFFLVPGDYYISVKCRWKEHATAFKMTVEATPA